MNRKIFCLLLMMTMLLPACRKHRLINPDPVAAASSQAATRDAILAGMKAEQWIATREDPGHIRAARSIKGKHDMDVAIAYDDTNVSLTYQNSRNLDHMVIDGVEYIHPNYNVWVNRLWWQIQVELSDARSK